MSAHQSTLRERPHVSREEVEQMRAEPCSSCGRIAALAIVSCRTRGGIEEWDTWCGACVREADDPAGAYEEREREFLERVRRSLDPNRRSHARPEDARLDPKTESYTTDEAQEFERVHRLLANAGLIDGGET